MRRHRAPEVAALGDVRLDLLDLVGVVLRVEEREQVFRGLLGEEDVVGPAVLGLAVKMLLPQLGR